MLGGRDPGPEARPPNIVFILSDDEDVALHAYAPKIKRLIEDEGTVFDNAFVTYSLCCPSRASIFRGQYPHNTKVLGNLPPFGGFQTFRRLGRESSTTGTWLQDAGYRTAFYGKYLNGYTEKDAPPPGWDEWHAANNDGYKGIDYIMNSNGEAVPYGHAPEDYLTDVIAGKAVDHIRRWSAANEPFYLHIAPFNPHSPYNPAPRHAGSFANAELPRPPSFDEADVSDKPAWIRSLPRLTEQDIDDITGHYRARLECLQSVDDLAESVVNALEEAGQLDNTYIVYLSDNGFHLGEHRMKEGKDTAYEEDIRVPMAIRGPGIPKGQRVSSFVLNTDIAPTFAEWSGASLPDFVDGRSLMPLFGDVPPESWRSHFLIQRNGLESDERPAAQTANSAMAIRTPTHLWSAYRNGETELYDLRSDPFQLDNIASSADPALIESMTKRLTELADCRGEDCRRFEDAPLE